MESEVKTRSTEGAAQSILEASGRMWKADNTGVYTTEPGLWEWEDGQGTDQFAAVAVDAKLWRLFEAPGTDSRFWRLVRGECWHAAPALPGGMLKLPDGTPVQIEPWDFQVDPGDTPVQVQEKLEHARSVLLQALADGELNE